MVRCARERERASVSATHASTGSVTPIKELSHLMWTKPTCPVRATVQRNETIMQDISHSLVYDVSTLLYLSTHSIDFSGGLFAFNDPDEDRLVEPVAGRLVAFDSGFDNLHQVRPVLAGERFVLSIWYRRVV